MARTRRNIANLPAGDQTVEWYEKAVAKMQAKPIADPTSWRYQAAIHEYIDGADPFFQPSDQLPSTAERARYWTQCQHGSWFFLPWHRMYLHLFEQIVLSEIAEMGGPSDWALPYWNYSASATAAALPKAFRSPTLPGGGMNHLYVSERKSGANAGKAIASAIDTGITNCLKEPKFAAGATGGSPGFGGPITVFEHSGGSIGSTEWTPHGTMHVAVGGATGWMSGFNTAALDPIFWLHHCNIDRLWEVWLARDSTHANPSTANWLTGVPFDFRDPQGNAITMVAGQVLDTKAAPLDYQYDDISDPLAISTTVIAGPSPPTPEVESVAIGRGDAMAEMVGATSSFRLDRGVVEQVIPVTPTGPAASAFHESVGRPEGSSSATPRMRVYLHVEGIKSRDRSIPYDVYLNLPPGAAPLDYPELRAGRLSMFGLVEASRSSQRHADHGLHYTIEITDLYHRLAAEPGWSRDDLRVFLVPSGEEGPAGAEVGRLSLYFE